MILLFAQILLFVLSVGAVTMAPSKKNPLKKYQSKRTFKNTPEPKGSLKKTRSIKKVVKKPLSLREQKKFVVHRHDASHLHYDLRLEIDGVLTSWAVPKGIPNVPLEKHLAVQTEDHPFEYLKFEGNIPEGNYGAGSVMVWDIGTYENLKSISMKEALEKGRIEILFHGKKLKSAYALIRTKLHGSAKNWLLFKLKNQPDRAASNKFSQKSVLTQRTQQQIEQEE